MLGLQRPPRWAIVTTLGLLAVNVGLVGLMEFRPAAADPYAGERVAWDTEPTETSTSGAATTSSPPVEREVDPILAVYGDGYSIGSDLGGRGEAGWPALVAEDVDATLHLAAASRSGYVSVGTTGLALPGIIAAEPVPDATVTVIFGSRNDLGSTRAAVQAAAGEAVATVRQANPTTALVLVGPAWSNADVPPELYPLRDAVQAVAERTGATFVDPLAEGWFREPGQLIAGDGVSPTDAGHQYLADLIAPVLESVATSTSGPNG